MSEPPRSIAWKIVAEHASDLSEERQKALADAIYEAMGEFAALAAGVEADAVSR